MSFVIVSLDCDNLILKNCGAKECGKMVIVSRLMLDSLSSEMYNKSAIKVL